MFRNVSAIFPRLGMSDDDQDTIVYSPWPILVCESWIVNWIVRHTLVVRRNGQ
jgi:hypothetical protein